MKPKRMRYVISMLVLWRYSSPYMWKMYALQVKDSSDYNAQAESKTNQDHHPYGHARHDIRLQHDAAGVRQASYNVQFYRDPSARPRMTERPTRNPSSRSSSSLRATAKRP